MDSQSIEKLLATSRHYFSLPIPVLAKPELPPRQRNDARESRLSAKATRQGEQQSASNRNSLW